MVKKDYIKWIRSKVGHDEIILNFAGAVIENDKGEILLQKRGDNGGWGLFGGAMELGESAEETAIREVQEESGYMIEVDRLVGIYTKYDCEYGNGDKAQTIVVLFSCKILGNSDDYDNSETVEMKFFARNNLPKLFNQQHTDGLNDYLAGNYGSYR
jgi:8-oxo-dGTP pyrophosphatase MutT (NUDIX family)